MSMRDCDSQVCARTEMAEEFRAGEGDLDEVPDLRDLLVEASDGIVRVRRHAGFYTLRGSLHRT